MSALHTSFGLDTPGTADVAILGEIARLQNKRTSPWLAILVVAVSALAFVAVSKADVSFGRQSWQTVAILVGVLFFHELGHFVAMKLLGYRNLQMFFIPFLGAGVRGHNYAAQGWKKVVVALMGPLPGIVVGGALGIDGIVMQRPWMIEAGLMAVVVNGFNLLPVLPLDGGHVMHTLLFSRHYLADAGFRLLAALLLIWVGPLIGAGQVMLALGVVMLVGLPISWKLGKIATEFRAGSVPLVPASDLAAGPTLPGMPGPIEEGLCGIPAAQAVAIIPKVRQAFPRKTSDKATAQYTLQVCELLNARPPGWLGTLALTGLAGGTFLVALVLTLVLMLAQRADLKRFALLSAVGPRHSVSSSSIRLVSGEQAGDRGQGRKTVIATFKRARDAEKAFADLTAGMPERTRIELFGASLLVEIPVDDDAGRRRWFGDLESLGAAVFVDIGRAESMFRFQCLAPNEEAARAIEEEVGDYFRCSGVYLVAPWDCDDSRTAAQRIRHHVARQTYKKVIVAGQASYESPESKKISQAIRLASRQGDQAEADRLLKQQERMHEDLRQRDIEALRAQGPDKVDLAVIDRYVTYLAEEAAATRPADSEDDESADNGYMQMLTNIAPCLGQVPMDDGKPTPGSDRYCATTGYVLREGLLLSFSAILFVNPMDGARAMAKWLLDKRCMSCRYEFGGGFSVGEATE